MKLIAPPTPSGLAPELGFQKKSKTRNLAFRLNMTPCCYSRRGWNMALIALSSRRAPFYPGSCIVLPPSPQRCKPFYPLGVSPLHLPWQLIPFFHVCVLRRLLCNPEPSCVNLVPLSTKKGSEDAHRLLSSPETRAQRPRCVPCLLNFTLTCTPLMLCQLGRFFFKCHIMLIIYEWYVCTHPAAGCMEPPCVLRVVDALKPRPHSSPPPL